MGRDFGFSVESDSGYAIEGLLNMSKNPQVVFWRKTSVHQTFGPEYDVG